MRRCHCLIMCRLRDLRLGLVAGNLTGARTGVKFVAGRNFDLL